MLSLLAIPTIDQKKMEMMAKNQVPLTSDAAPIDIGSEPAPAAPEAPAAPAAPATLEAPAALEAPATEPKA